MCIFPVNLDSSHAKRRGYPHQQQNQQQHQPNHQQQNQHHPNHPNHQAAHSNANPHHQRTHANQAPNQAHQRPNDNRPGAGPSAGAGGGHKPGGVKRATDDYHYDKFKKQFRRY